MAEKNVTFNPLVSVSVFDLGSSTSTAASGTGTNVPLISFGGATAQAATAAPSINVPATSTIGAQQGPGCLFGFNPTASTSSGGGFGTTAAATSIGQSLNEGASKPETFDAKQPSMTYSQLQELLNKFTKETQEEENNFYEQALKVNVWDRTLAYNGEKIVRLNSQMEKMRDDHSRVENTLSGLKSQEMELQNLLVALESTLPPDINNVDPARAEIYSTAESVGQELIEISSDLKIVIEHINERNNSSSQYSSSELVKIMKIVNEHSDALLWVEKQCNELSKGLTETQKGHQIAKNKHVEALRQLGR
ncbi:unnamed protein product [Orchesella dallaii]|uniref:Nucleoporin NSP1-like C-terminal domain-containing protein n=1 Tax=Orchesella dallaii TaxID=48710 RepID=A0ABP1QSS8_9HEXA